MNVPNIVSENILQLCTAQLNEFVMLDEDISSERNSFFVNPVRDETWSLMRSGDVTQAISAFNDILSIDLQDPVSHLDLSLCLLEVASYPDAIAGFKKVVTLVRRRNRLPKVVKSPKDGEGMFVSGNALLYAAYTSLGKAYEASNRIDRAIASYTLALKAYHPSNLDGHWDIFSVGNSQTFLSRLLNQNQSEIDLEDLLKDSTVASLESPFHFSCTMCGECCRSSDQILLTPQDIFRLTRCSSLLSLHHPK
jgi:tetratricopeptide (TPR) repeat protein